MERAAIVAVQDLVMGVDVGYRVTKQVSGEVSPSIFVGLAEREGRSSTYGSSVCDCLMPFVDEEAADETSGHSLYRCPTL